MHEGRFQDRVAIVTGGAAGAGLAVARRIVREGGAAALWDLDEYALDKAANEDGATLTLQVNVADPDAVELATNQVREKFGRIDLLMCSAGITGETAPVDAYPLESWRQVIDINLNGVFYCCRAVVPHMKENGYGRIVNMSSVGGKEGNPNAAAYAASKAGVLGFTKALGKELATSGILANAVTPAVFRTSMLEQMPESFVDFLISKIPMGRVGEVDEIASLVCWLLSEECSFSTAATFDASGGRSTY